MTRLLIRWLEARGYVVLPAKPARKWEATPLLDPDGKPAIHVDLKWKGWRAL